MRFRELPGRTIQVPHEIASTTWSQKVISKRRRYHSIHIS